MNYSKMRITMAILSFFCFCTIVFSLPQMSKVEYPVERSAIAAAVSYCRYEAPFGKMYSGLSNYYLRHVRVPLQELLENNLPKGIDLGPLLDRTGDGSGAGYVLFATLAMSFFGVNAWSLPIFMLVIMGFSALLFLFRFRAEYSGVIVYYFLSLSILAITPLVLTPGYFFQLPIGGSRYSSLVSILPGVYILMDILHSKGSADKKKYLIFLFFQSLILTWSVLMYGSTIFMLAIIVFSIFCIYIRNNAAAIRTALTKKITTMIISGVSFFVFSLMLLPKSYVDEGYFTQIFWHRVVISLGVSPDWPRGFQGLAESYDAKPFIPEGIVKGVCDRNGHCIWVSYILKNGIEKSKIHSHLYGSMYESVMRDAFFDIAKRYPRQTFDVFTKYKTLYFVMSLSEFPGFQFSNTPNKTLFLVFCATAIAIMHIIISAKSPTPSRWIVSVVGISYALICIPAYYIAWASPYTIKDFIFYLFFCLFLIAEESLRAIIRLIKPVDSA